MEDRIQGGLKEGAGLEESRLNKEFIDFMQVWGPRVLIVIAMIAGGYFLYGKYKLSREAAMARAFAELDAAVVARNPGSLLRVADEQSGKAAVPLLARLAAADLYLEASRTSVPPGILLDPTGALPEGTAYLTEDEKKAQLGKAATEYETVFAAASPNDGLAIHAVSALFGLASVAESRGELDKAKEQYTKLIEIANRVGYTREAEAAQKRIDTLPELETMPRIYAQSDLYIVKSAVAPVQVKTADGSVVTVEGAGTTLASPALKPPTGTGTPATDAMPTGTAPAGSRPTPAQPEPTPAPEPAPTPAPGR